MKKWPMLAISLCLAGMLIFSGVSCSILEGFGCRGPAGEEPGWTKEEGINFVNEVRQWGEAHGISPSIHYVNYMEGSPENEAWMVVGQRKTSLARSMFWADFLITAVGENSTASVYKNTVKQSSPQLTVPQWIEKLEAEGYDVYVAHYGYGGVVKTSQGQIKHITPEFLKVCEESQPEAVREIFTANIQSVVLQSSAGQKFYNQYPHLFTSFIIAVSFNMALQFFAEKYGTDSTEYQRMANYYEKQEASAQHAVYWFSKLDELYFNPNKTGPEKLAEREAILEEAQVPFDFYYGAGAVKVNNAFLMMTIAQARYFELADALWKKAGSVSNLIPMLAAMSTEKMTTPYPENWPNETEWKAFWCEEEIAKILRQKYGL